MVVVIIILAILLILVITASAIIFKEFYGIVQRLAADDSEVLRQWLEENTEEEIHCNVIWTFKNNYDFEGTIYDFSKFQENGIVGITTCCKEKYFFEEQFFDEENEPIISIIPDQTILLLKDGGYEWDMRPYL